MTTGNRNPNANNATGATLTASSGKKRKKDTSNGEDNSTNKREDYDTEYWQRKIKEGIEMHEKYEMNPSRIADKIGMNQRAFRRKLKRYYIG